MRVSLPALNNNLVNLVKTTTQAFGIAVPELLYQSVTIWNDYPSALYPTMLLVFVVYVVLVGILVMSMSKWEPSMRIPGYGSAAARANIPARKSRDRRAPRPTFRS
ncbi:MAG: hypothetical protein CM15mP115_05390 [Alphaproteobacteria bacterium]|nr:MAG: hypothetical protein CM15mP115_05390 [Alphaproteobacteria bacterium]